jgi:hypothetical protein
VTPTPEDAVETPEDTVAAGGRRLWLGRVATVAAALLVLVALVLPNQPEHLTPAAFLRIPVEGLLAVALVLLLPARARRAGAVAVGAILGILAILKVFDLGFFSVLARPFDPVLDWRLLGAATTFLTEAVGRAGATVAAVAAVLLGLAVLALVTLSVVRLAGPVARHRAAAGGTVAVLGVVWVVCALLGAQIVPGVPVAAHQYDRVGRVSASLQDRQEFAAEAAVDAFRETPGEELLTALRGKDVIVAFVESYGRYTVESPEFAPRIGAALEDGDDRLRTAGFDARSGFLTAPTIGGVSWLCHATLLSGLWVDNQQRYRTLVTSDRLTLNRAFQRADWRTVAVMPAIWQAWPEGRFFGYDEVYNAARLDYHGPRMNWGIIPDQYTMAAFERFERARLDRKPVMATIPLISTHAPWTPVPTFIDWEDAGHSAGFEAVEVPDESVDEVWNDPERVREHYLMAMEYTLETLISYVETYGDEDLVLVILGDHQPPRLIIGQEGSHDVPISIISGDPAVLDQVAGWRWHDGLKPGPQAPVWPMDAFRDQFLTAFSAPGAARSPAPTAPEGQ